MCATWLLPDESSSEASWATLVGLGEMNESICSINGVQDIVPAGLAFGVGKIAADSNCMVGTHQRLRRVFRVVDPDVVRDVHNEAHHLGGCLSTALGIPWNVARHDCLDPSTRRR